LLFGQNFSRRIFFVIKWRVNLFKSFPRNFYIAVVDLKGKNQVGANAIKLFFAFATDAAAN
jgi:hypothetical protein